MAFPLLDTSVFPTYKKEIEQRFEFIYFSTIVLYELTASTIDQSTLQKYERWKIALNKADRLLIQKLFRLVLYPANHKTSAFLLVSHLS